MSTFVSAGQCSSLASSAGLGKVKVAAICKHSIGCLAPIAGQQSIMFSTRPQSSSAQLSDMVPQCVPKIKIQFKKQAYQKMKPYTPCQKGQELSAHELWISGCHSWYQCQGVIIHVTLCRPVDSRDVLAYFRFTKCGCSYFAVGCVTASFMLLPESWIKVMLWKNKQHGVWFLSLQSLMWLKRMTVG